MVLATPKYRAQGIRACRRGRDATSRVSELLRGVQRGVEATIQCAGLVDWV